MNDIAKALAALTTKALLKIKRDCSHLILCKFHCEPLLNQKARTQCPRPRPAAKLKLFRLRSTTRCFIAAEFGSFPHNPAQRSIEFMTIRYLRFVPVQTS